MLNVQDIDAYWLHRKISQAYEKIDPLHCQKLAEDVLKILAEGGDDSDVENRLVILNLLNSFLMNRLNIIWCTPTGVGKTNVAMLTILQQIALHWNTDGTFNHSNYKIAYVAPMKALVAEVVGNLSCRLRHYGVNVNELSGDQTLSHQQIDETQIIVTTPEKWDIITRKSRDGTHTLLVKLLIIDEIYLLHDNRGPVLESIIARTVRQIEATK
ncbi:DExH-box ATP-dependent RNA helicase DExH12-like protein [Cinnamomum micranthum f. kanehirae]|uniref:DExH-box ATP-dependent RNA helicase DExH12-like protein n=1 Tax=Cinnamomum micranthum f. kanehirae TaxID=337451 RepID=A0A443PU75_9MAGN|nr:DExH-box ATP-dependent RNA helicase DExH12-like protein [Cinnamomum micranthum f. kanehirae]